MILRPMTCPHHFQYYASRLRSYRELPFRIAELAKQFRYEKSGELLGLLRVRAFCLADSHIICQKDQALDELNGVLDLIEYIASVMGYKPGEHYRYRLSLGDRQDEKKYYKDDEAWNYAENVLRDVLKQRNANYFEAENEAAFYGPKADFVVTDCIGREWQLGTVQLDYNLPGEERFAMEYIGPDNKPHRPVMIHRAPFGSLERFVGMLIEHFAGAFPLWLAPEQVRVLVVSQKFEQYGRDVQKQLGEAGLRASGDYRAEKIGAKIRDAQLELIPYMFIIGGREMEQEMVSLRDRLEGDLGT